MAHFCTRCEYLFDGGREACPRCGGRVVSDGQPDSSLLALGYRFAPGQTGSTTPSDASMGGGPSDGGSSGDYYDLLLSSFESNADYGAGIRDGAACGSRREEGAAKESAQAGFAAHDRNAVFVAPDAGGDFFASFGGQSNVAVPERVETPADIVQAPAKPKAARGLARRARAQDGSRYLRSAGGAALGVGRGLVWLVRSNSLGARILRTVLILAAIAAALWSARFAIADLFGWVLYTVAPVAVLCYIAYRVIRVK